MGGACHGRITVSGDKRMSRYFSAAKRRQLKDLATRRAALMADLDDVFMASGLRAIVTVEEAWERIRNRMYAEHVTYTRSDLQLEEHRK